MDQSYKREIDKKSSDWVRKVACATVQQKLPHKKLKTGEILRMFDSVDRNLEAFEENVLPKLSNDMRKKIDQLQTALRTNGDLRVDFEIKSFLTELERLVDEETTIFVLKPEMLHIFLHMAKAGWQYCKDNALPPEDFVTVERFYLATMLRIALTVTPDGPSQSTGAPAKRSHDTRRP